LEKEKQLAAVKKEADEERKRLKSEKEASLASQRISYEGQLESMKSSY
jgi:hypothetical protein